jgi:hypothetical protein
LVEKVFSSYFFNKITRPFRITRQLKIGKKSRFLLKISNKTNYFNFSRA